MATAYGIVKHRKPCSLSDAVVVYMIVYGLMTILWFVSGPTASF